MVFESSAVDPRTGNNLTSPEFSLSSDRELSFTMARVPLEKICTVYVYKTTTLGHISTLLGSYVSAWDASGGRNVTHTMCLPAGTYRLVFYALQPADVAESAAAIMKVQLTESSCTYTPPEGRPASN